MRTLLINSDARGGPRVRRHSKISTDLDNVAASSTIEVIVRFVDPPSKDELKQLGPFGRMKHMFDRINGVHLTLPASAVDASGAAVNGGVAADYGLDGTGMEIVILDSGVTLRQDLKRPPVGASRIVYSEDFTGLGGTDDGYGHGTHVAGIAAGNGKASSDLYDHTRVLKGIAPGANIINLRVLDNSGQGTDSTVIAGIQRAIALKSQYNIRVINLSLGRPVYESFTQDPLCQAVEAAWNAGIVVVVAAGNEGRNNNSGIGGYGTISLPETIRTSSLSAA